MPGAGTLTVGAYGKLPAHGDFVRRGLPLAFVTPWDDWLQAGMAAAEAALGDAWSEAWAAAPAWRFALPPGACGPDAAAGVLLPSQDAVGRRFPLTAGAVVTGAVVTGAMAWPPAWFAELEGALLQARAEGHDIDALAARLPHPTPADPVDAPPPGWWTAATETEPGLIWPLPALPEPDEFHLLLVPT